MFSLPLPTSCLFPSSPVNLVSLGEEAKEVEVVAAVASPHFCLWSLIQKSRVP